MTSGPPSETETKTEAEAETEPAPEAGTVPEDGPGLITAFAPEAGIAPDADTTPEADIEAGIAPEADTTPDIAPEADTTPDIAPEAGYPPDGSSGHPEIPHVRVDARLLEATLLNLRKRVAAIPLVYQTPGASEVAAERTKLLSQIDDYLLPRVRQSAAPLLVALVGSTGAGKSTLINSIVGTQVSATGVRRPTTNSPVLACHPDDIGWFAENMFLPTLPRVRQEGLARPGRDGLLVLAASEGMAKGVALLDTPDIDSVIRAHHEFAYQFLDASDLWLFMTSATRYADAPVWEILQHARERGAALGVILSRVPPSHRAELVNHFSAMLDANGILAADRFVIPETPIVDGVLPTEAFTPIRDWLAETAQRSDRRVAVLTQTMSGVLDTFKARIPKLAAHVDAQVMLRNRLRRDAEEAYRTALTEFDRPTRSGAVLGGEVLARWRDYATSGDLDDALHSRKPRKGKRARRGQGGTRTSALDVAVRSALEALVVAVADRAAEQVAAKWNAEPAGAAMLAEAASARAEEERADQVFADAFGGDGNEPAASREPPPGKSLERSSPDLAARAARAVSGWQDQLIRMIGSVRYGKKPVDDGEPLSLVLVLAMLGEAVPAAEAAAAGSDDGIAGAPIALLEAVFGRSELAELIARARADLRERIRLLLDEELLRFIAVLDSAGPVDDIAAVRLYQAEYSLEGAR